MAYGIVHHFPGGTKEQYEASLAAVHPGPGQLPAGQIFHAAGPSKGGWTIWPCTTRRRAGSGSATRSCSRASEKGIEGGFEAMPQETTVDVYSLKP